MVGLRCSCHGEAERIGDRDIGFTLKAAASPQASQSEAIDDRKSGTTTADTLAVPLRTRITRLNWPNQPILGCPSLSLVRYSRLPTRSALTRLQYIANENENEHENNKSTHPQSPAVHMPLLDCVLLRYYVPMSFTCLFVASFPQDP